MELGLHELKFDPSFFFFFYFDRSIPIAAFREPYSGVLYGTRAPWTRVPCKGFIFIFIYIYIYIFSLIAPYSIFYKSSFTLKLNFEKIEFQNRDIYLISLGKGTKCWFFCMKMAFVHFGHKYNAKRIKHTTIERKKKKKVLAPYLSHSWRYQ